MCVCVTVINAENAVHRSDKFLAMATRTRQEYLRDLAQNYVSPTSVDSGSRLGLLAISISQSINHSEHIYIAVYVVNESEALHNGRD